MARKYTFGETESGGREYVIAQPRTEVGEPVRLAADWVEGDEVEGKWERAVGAVIKADLMGAMELEESNGRLRRERAVETLAAAEDDDGPLVTGEAQAEALLEYLAEEDVVEFEDGDVVLLRDPYQDDVSSKMMLNWAASIDACVGKITETIDRVEAAKQKLDDQVSKIDRDAGQVDERLQETAQELQSLGDGQGVPDPSELDPEERERYDQLKYEFVYHKKMQEVGDEDLLEKVRSGTNALAQNVRMLESAREKLSEKQQQVRTLAIQKEVFPEEAADIVENMGNLATQLASVGDIDEAADELTPDELGDQVEDIVGSTARMTETVQDAAGEETDRETTDLQF